MIGANVLVTGGTGSFGQVIVRQLLASNALRVRVLSRDEAKQDAMRELFDDRRLEFVTGDVRDLETVVTAMHGAEYVFHAAALKQVPNCERHPMEAIRTNTLGSENVRVAALRCQPRSLVAISTDKACSPINTMGLSKALMERIFLQPASRGYTKFICVRYGNVIGSRGSVVPLFLDRIRRGLPLPVTNFDMTRFLLRLPQAVETALEAAVKGEHGELWVRKMPASTISSLVAALAPVDYPLNVVGLRPGEKMHEVLVNEEEMRRTENRGSYFVVGPNSTGATGEYTSANTEQLSVEALREMFRSAEMIQ